MFTKNIPDIVIRDGSLEVYLRNNKCTVFNYPIWNKNRDNPNDILIFLKNMEKIQIHNNKAIDLRLKRDIFYITVFGLFFILSPLIEYLWSKL